MRLGFAFVLFLAGCARDGGEILVHLQSDLPAAALDSYTITVSSSLNTAKYTYQRSDHDFPASFSITSKDGVLDRRVTVKVEGFLGSRLVASGSRAFSRFFASETRHLCIFLTRRCAEEGRSCSSEESCGLEGCS